MVQRGVSPRRPEEQWGGRREGGARVPGRSVGRAWTGLDVGRLAAGWLLGGTVGIGTVAFALTIGPLAQLFLPIFAVNPDSGHPDALTPP